MGHLELSKKDDVSSFRKMAIGTWRTAYDPSVYGTLTVRMDKALRYIDEFRQKTGKRLTVTHLVTKACAEALRRCPDANAILRFNRIYQRKRITISVLVVQTDEGDGKVDLTAAKIEDADRKSLAEMVDEMEDTIQRVRARKDKALEKGKGTVRMIPFLLMNLFLKVLSFLMYTLNIDLSFAGMPKDAFGSLTVTNVGSLGLETAYVPLVPYTRTAIYVAPGLVKEVPVAEEGRVVIGKVMNVNATFDHRFIDGFHASVLSKTLKEMMENPFERFDDLALVGAEPKKQAAPA
ncbi:MAG: 2-oxo acid dehydrogenase subunit E2 [Myxococcales bacterium]|nr:2-oxo acid dehydrogenase subunit E2 [Myxococcales bacterium]